MSLILIFLLCPSRNQSLSPDRFSTTTTTTSDVFVFFNQFLYTTYKEISSQALWIGSNQDNNMKSENHSWTSKIHTAEISTLRLTHTVYDTTKSSWKQNLGDTMIVELSQCSRKFWIEKRIPCSVFSGGEISEADRVLVCPKKTDPRVVKRCM